MVTYSELMKELLRPLGIYDLETGTLNGAELESAGAALDTLEAALEQTERESILATAEGPGLERWASLFSLQPVDAGTALRRSALMALMQVGGDSFTLSAVNRAIRGCGVMAEVQERPERGHVRVTFPGVAGIPEGFGQIQRVIEALLPCHLAAEFYFRYITWAECQARGFTWEMLHEGAYTWGSFQKSVELA